MHRKVSWRDAAFCGDKFQLNRLLVQTNEADQWHDYNSISFSGDRRSPFCGDRRLETFSYLIEQHTGMVNRKLLAV